MEWIDPSMEPEWSTWLRPVANEPNGAYCNTCRKKFYLSNMGRQAIIIHASYAKHIRQSNLIAKTLSIKSCFTARASITPVSTTSPPDN